MNKKIINEIAHKFANTDNFEIINYFDVWGNPVDGWEVNNCCSEGTCYIAENSTEKDVARFLYNAGLTTTSDMRRIAIEFDSENYEVYERKGMKPIFSLRSIA